MIDSALVVLGLLGFLAAVYLLLALLWWQCDAPCKRCGKKHWSYETRKRCRMRYELWH